MEGKTALLKSGCLPFTGAEQSKTIFVINLKQSRKHNFIINLVIFELGISGGYVLLISCVYEMVFSTSSVTS